MTGLPPLERATWPEVDASDRRLLMLPLGSTEQHGPHLPLCTDTLVATRLATAVHAREPRIGLAPAMPFGASGEHAHFPGTLSIGTEALLAVLVEFARHASLHWRHLLVVNGHGGNVEALRRFAERMSYEGRSVHVHHAVSGGPRADAHAGHRETSLLLYLRPDLVRVDRAAAGATAPLAELLPRLSADGVRAVSANGVLGDPTGADAATGERVFAELVDRLLARATALLATE